MVCLYPYKSSTYNININRITITFRQLSNKYVNFTISKQMILLFFQMNFLFMGK